MARIAASRRRRSSGVSWEGRVCEGMGHLKRVDPSGLRTATGVLAERAEDVSTELTTPSAREVSGEKVTKSSAARGYEHQRR